MGRRDTVNLLDTPGTGRSFRPAAGGGGAAGVARAAVLWVLMLAAASFLARCGKTEERLERIAPEHVAREFFEAWKRQDWKALYRLTHPAFIQNLRMQKLSPEQMAMSDEELFVSEFMRVQRMNPAKTLISYRIRSITPYKRGDTTVWLDAIVNGRRRTIPLTLDGLSLKIDLTRIK